MTRTPLQEIVWLRACLEAALALLKKDGEEEIRLPAPGLPVGFERAAPSHGAGSPAAFSRAER